MKIVLFRYDTGIVSTLSLKYDDCRRSRRDAPAADIGEQIHTPCPATPRRGSDTGVYRMEKIFMVRV